MDSFVSLIQAAVVFGTVIMFGAVGETLTEKSGNLNLGVPGIMYLGAIASLTSTFFYENAVENPSMIVCVIIALVCGVAASMLGCTASFTIPCGFPACSIIIALGAVPVGNYPVHTLKLTKLSALNHFVQLPVDTVGSLVEHNGEYLV